MPNVIKTSRGRVLDLPVSTKDIVAGEEIVATNAPGGRVYIDDDGQSEVYLRDASLLEQDDPKYQYIGLKMINDLQKEEEIGFAAKLKHVRDLESRRGG